MKWLKICLVIMVLGAIVFITKCATDTTKTVGDTPPPKNSFILTIEQKIDSLKKLADNKSCKEAYNEVESLIEEYHAPHPPKFAFGRLGQSQSDNDKEKVNLKNSLYSVYAEKFIQQSFYVFQSSEWKSEDLSFIRAECLLLQNSPLLEKNSYVDNKFSEIQKALDKYDEIIGFLSTCNGYPNIGYGLEESFPISDVQNKISEAVSYLNNNLGNQYVYNCSRLQSGLKEVPKVLFMAHVNYLDNKINHWLRKYSDEGYGFTSYADYSKRLNEPLQNEIDALDKSIYNVAEYQTEYDRLTKKWSNDNEAAYAHF